MTGGSRWLGRLAALCCLFLAWPAGAQVDDERLIQSLADPSYKVRLMAAIQIGKNRIRSAAPALRQALADPNDTVRAAAALALGKIDAQAARPDLAGLLASPKGLVFKAASKALGLLDRGDGRSPRYLVVVDPPILAPGVAPRAGKRLVRALDRRLASDGLIVPGAGEQRAVQGKRLAAHLKLRGLQGMLLRPKLLALSVTESGGGTTFACRISVMVVTLTGNRMEFAGNGEAEAEVPQQGLDPDTIDEVRTQVLDASIEAAVDGALGYLARRTGP